MTQIFCDFAKFLDDPSQIIRFCLYKAQLDLSKPRYVIKENSSGLLFEITSTNDFIYQWATIFFLDYNKTDFIHGCLAMNMHETWSIRDVVYFYFAQLVGKLQISMVPVYHPPEIYQRDDFLE